MGSRDLQQIAAWALAVLVLVASRPAWGTPSELVAATAQTLGSWAASPPVWLLALGAVLSLAWVTAAVANLGVRQDARRSFTPSERQEIFRRAGYRCEHKSPLWFRCAARASHADHVHPHVRGGATHLDNAQALCARHNLRKSATVPTLMEVWRLQRRRRRYFPRDVVAVSARARRTV